VEEADHAQLLGCMFSITIFCHEADVLTNRQANYVALCLRFLPDFPINYVGWTLDYVAALMPMPDIHFNVSCFTLSQSRGSRLVALAKQNNRLMFSWSVRGSKWMEWCIRLGLDGVVADDPKLFLEICDRWPTPPVHKALTIRQTVRQAIMLVGLRILAWVLDFISSIKKGSPRSQVKKTLGV
jgi:phosphatidylglycerol phospholipase C